MLLFKATFCQFKGWFVAFGWTKFVMPAEISPAVSGGRRNALFHYTHLLQRRDVKEINNICLSLSRKCSSLWNCLWSGVGGGVDFIIENRLATLSISLALDIFLALASSALRKENSCYVRSLTLYTLAAAAAKWFIFSRRARRQQTLLWACWCERDVHRSSQMNGMNLLQEESCKR